MSSSKQLVTVYRAKSDMEAQVIKSLLESYGIPSLLKSNAAPSVHIFTLDGMGEVKVMVWDDEAEAAKELIEDSDV